MKKITDIVTRETVITTLDLCPDDDTQLKVKLDIGIGFLRPKLKWCTSCGRELVIKGAKPIPTR